MCVGGQAVSLWLFDGLAGGKARACCGAWHRAAGGCDQEVSTTERRSPPGVAVCVANVTPSPPLLLTLEARGGGGWDLQRGLKVWHSI